MAEHKWVYGCIYGGYNYNPTSRSYNSAYNYSGFSPCRTPHVCGASSWGTKAVSRNTQRSKYAWKLTMKHKYPPCNWQFAPENQWLEDDPLYPFLLGHGLFSGAFAVKFQGVYLGWHTPSKDANAKWRFGSGITKMSCDFITLGIGCE